MHENCSPNDCPLEPRVSSLERANEQRGETHREIFQRLNKVERKVDVHDSQYQTIAETLAKIEETVTGLAEKPGKRWDGLVDKLIYAAALAAVAWIAAGMPGIK